jgi:carbon storage regulator
MAAQEDGTVLILSRKRKQQIVLGDRIVVTVVRIRGKTVQLGIDAPEEVPVHRKEIHDARRGGRLHQVRQRDTPGERMASMGSKVPGQ